MDWRLGASACCVLTLAAAPALAAIDVVGSDRASFAWAPATGPVASYSVYVAKNGSEATLYSVVSGRTEEVVRADYGDTVVVQVAAADETGQEGPRSDPSPEVRFLAPPEPPPEPVAQPAPSDFDGDGFSDLWLSDPRTGRSHLFSVAEGSFESAAQLPTMPDGWELVATEDHDGNGSADALWRNADTGRLDLWLLDGGNLVAVDMIRGAEGADWIVAACDDFDGDGRADLALRQPASGDLELWLMNGTVVSEILAWTGGPGSDTDVASSGDYNGTGRADLLWHGPGYGLLEAWMTDDALGFEGLVLDSALDAGWEVAGSADFGGDGVEEFVLRHRALGRLEVHAIDGLAMTLPNPDPGLEIADLGDYDGDGASDLLFHAAESGAYTAWLVSAAGDVTTRDLGDPFGASSDGDTSDCQADLDGDGVVGIADFGALRRCFGQSASGSCSAADLNGDGRVGWADFNAFRAAFTEPCSAP